MLAEINKVIDVLKESPVKIGAKTGTGKNSVALHSTDRKGNPRSKVMKSIADAFIFLTRVKNSNL